MLGREVTTESHTGSLWSHKQAALHKIEAKLSALLENKLPVQDVSRGKCRLQNE